MPQLPPALLKSDVHQKRGFGSHGHLIRFCLTRHASLVSLNAACTCSPLTSFAEIFDFVQNVFTYSEKVTLTYTAFQRLAHYCSLRCECLICQKIRSHHLPLTKQFSGLFCEAESYHEFFQDNLVCLLIPSELS